MEEASTAEEGQRIHLEDATYSWGAWYFAASGRMCRRLLPTAGTTEVRLVCETPDGWLLMPALHSSPEVQPGTAASVGSRP